MAETFNPQAEKKAAAKATRKLKASFKTAIQRSANVTPGGPSSKATVRSKFRAGRLDRLTFVAPHYIFKQHFGFEGVKSNGVNMRLKSTKVLSRAVLESGALSELATTLADLRAAEVISKINFKL